MGGSHVKLLKEINAGKDPKAAGTAMRTLWDHYDLNGDGVVNGKEFETLLNHIAKYCQTLQDEHKITVVDSVHEADKLKHWLRNSLDIDGDGQLTRDEFMSQIGKVLRAESVGEGLNAWEHMSSEEKILTLQRQTEGVLDTNMSKSGLRKEFANLFCDLDQNALLRVRRQMDSNLVFREDGRSVDLRSLVFEVLDEADSVRVLECIAKGCKHVSKNSPYRRRGPFVLLSDVDDTLLPGRDLLHIAGKDRSWKLDGSLYPGVVQMHKELRGAGPDDYTVLFTARPPSMCQNLAFTLARITGPEERPRMAILPGTGTRQGVKNVGHMKLMGDASNLGKKKLERFREYVQLFPDHAGKYVFLGDDGQADFDIVDDMLAAKHPETQDPYLAFAAIHAVYCSGQFHKFEECERMERTQTKRQTFPGVPKPSTAPAFPGEHHRFFYFLDYDDLAKQLQQAGWISEEAQQRVQGWFQVEKVDASQVSAEVTKCKGYISAGDNIKQEVMTVESAMEYAKTLPDCQGFCFEAPDEVVASDKQFNMFFKSKVDMTEHAGWTSYIFTSKVEHWEPSLDSVPAEATMGTAIAQQVDGHPNVALREGSPAGKVIAMVPNGEMLKVLRESGDSVEVQWQELRGFVKASNLI